MNEPERTVRIDAALELGRPGERIADLPRGERPHASQGRSHAEIAEAPFLAKTASVHVSNVKAKLGLATRFEVAPWAPEMGLG